MEFDQPAQPSARDDDLLGSWADRLRVRPTVTVEEAADLIGLSRTGAYAAVRNGQLPSIRVGRRIVVPTARLLRMLGEEGPDRSESLAG